MIEKSIINDLKRQGYSFLPAITREAQGSLLALAKRGDGKAGVYDEDQSLGVAALSILGLSKSELEDLHQAIFESQAPKDSFYFIKRETNNKQRSEAFRMHFDSHRLTIVVPLRIPTGGGSFIAFPSLRDEPNWDLLNLLQKIWFRRHIGTKAIERLAREKSVITADFSDNRPLIFLGRTTLHGNEPFEGIETRVTCLIHMFDPDQGFGVGSLVRKIRGVFTR